MHEERAHAQIRKHHCKHFGWVRTVTFRTSRPTLQLALLLHTAGQETCRTGSVSATSCGCATTIGAGCAIITGAASIEADVISTAMLPKRITPRKSPFVIIVGILSTALRTFRIRLGPAPPRPLPLVHACSGFHPSAWIRLAGPPMHDLIGTVTNRIPDITNLVL